MTNQFIYGETWTQQDRRNVLRLASWCDGLPSYRVDFDSHGKALLSSGKEHVRASEYLPSGVVCPAFLEVDGWSMKDSLFGVLTRTDVRGVTWDAIQQTKGQHLRFSFRDKDNPYKRSSLISLGRPAYFFLFRGIGRLPTGVKSLLVQAGYSCDLHTTHQAASC